jgi:hypothetical protein
MVVARNVFAARAMDNEEDRRSNIAIKFYVVENYNWKWTQAFAIAFAIARDQA